ncbi:MAG: hypothetical protein HOM20_00170 [Porticoccaceae bacterium]|nr:hypothetical protein [Porticoccaceae bacterium]
MVKNSDENAKILTDDELEALLKRSPALKLSTYGEALAFKTKPFKRYLIVISALAVAYVGAFLVGVLDPYLAYGWSNMREHQELQQLRFIAGFIMLVLLHVWLLLGQRLETMMMTFTAMLTYFQFSGTANLLALDDAISNPGFMAVYVLLQSTFILLLLLLIREERRSLGSN